jgi:enoyl-CoA hydratase/carnithine racemase
MAHVASAAELLRCLDDPHASEAHSVLIGEPLLRVELGAQVPPEAGEAAAWRRLSQLAVPLVGVATGRMAPGAEALAAAVDVVAASEDELAAIEATVREAPLASLVLVQLLRGSLEREIPEGLLAESLAYSTLQAGPEFGAWIASRQSRVREPNPQPAVRVTRHAEHVELRLDRPEKRNAFSAEMRDGLSEALALVIQDASLRRVVLTGEGPSFSSGGDLDEFGSLPDPATAHAVRVTRSPAALLARCADRVEARASGPERSCLPSAAASSPHRTRSSSFPKWGWVWCPARGGP